GHPKKRPVREEFFGTPTQPDAGVKSHDHLLIWNCKWLEPVTQTLRPAPWLTQIRTVQHEKHLRWSRRLRIEPANEVVVDRRQVVSQNSIGLPTCLSPSAVLAFQFRKRTPAIPKFRGFLQEQKIM